MALAALLAGPGPGWAEAAAAAPPDSGAVETAAPRTGAAQTEPVETEAARAAPPRREPGFFGSPTGVMLRSLVIPGWGQATNREWWKAGIVVAAEGYLIYRIIEDSQRLEELDPLSLEYAQVQEQRTANAWWLGGVVFLSMVDAYVGAHLKDIEVQIGPEPGAAGVRLAVSRGFR